MFGTLCSLEIQNLNFKSFLVFSSSSTRTAESVLGGFLGWGSALEESVVFLLACCDIS